MKKVGDGTRVLNFLVDTLLYWILAILLYKWWNFHVLYWGYMHLNFGWFFFGSLFIYYFIFESLFAKTPAKWLTGCRVVSNKSTLDNTIKSSVGQILVRSFARLILIDPFFIPFLGTTLHDYLSGTMVVES
ncbi:MAG: hypothetical protein RL372_843 [Bacteroidota bacterium]|jgi:hypothetical protein